MPIIAGLLPTITLSAPAMTETPRGYNGTSIASMAYTPVPTKAVLGDVRRRLRTLGLTDVLTVDMKITDPEGFRAGNYSAATTLTCQR